MQSYHTIIQIFTLILSFLPILNGSDVINLSVKSPVIVNESEDFYIQKEDGKTLSDIYEIYQDGLFKKSDDLNASFNPLGGQYWKILEVVNVDSVDNDWIFSFRGWSKVDFYESTNSFEDYTMKTTGFSVAYKERDYSFANNNHILLSLKSGESKKIALSFHGGADHWLMPSGVFYNIRIKDQQDALNHRDELIMGVFNGIFLILFLYNLFLFFTTRDKDYLFYLLQIMTLLYTINATAGYTTSLFKNIEGIHLFRGTIESIISGLSGIFMILFTMYFLNTKNNLPRWHKFLKVYIGVIIVLSIGVNINFEVFGPLAYILTLVLTVSFITIGILSIKKKIPSAWYYLVAYVFSVLGIIVLVLTLSGVLPRTNFTMNYSLPTGYALELLFFSLALANKINVLKSENEKQQNEIITHLKEKEEFQLNYTDELERNVQLRTMEISSQKDVIEKERQKSEELLLNILPQASVEELKYTGKSKPKHHPSVSIIFTDFQEFTSTAEKISADDLVLELNDLFGHFDDIVVRHNVEKIKTIGDAYMAVSGLFSDDTNHAKNAVLSAIEMQRYLLERNKDHTIKWNARIGIHSGPVVSGIVGKKKFAFDIWGDSVNVASRLESTCKMNEINLSAESYAFVKDEFPGRYRGKIETKGKGELDMYYIDY